MLYRNGFSANCASRAQARGRMCGTIAGHGLQGPTGPRAGAFGPHCGGNGQQQHFVCCAITLDLPDLRAGLDHFGQCVVGIAVAGTDDPGLLPGWNRCQRRPVLHQQDFPLPELVFARGCRNKDQWKGDQLFGVACQTEGDLLRRGVSCGKGQDFRCRAGNYSAGVSGAPVPRCMPAQND